MNANVLLVIILTVIAGFTIYGVHSGFFKTMIPILTIVLTCWIVSIIIPYFKAYLNNDVRHLAVLEIICDILAFIVTFFVMHFLLKLLLKALDRLTEIPVIHGINKTLGFVGGMFEGLLVIWTLFYLILVFLGRDGASGFFAMIDANIFLRWLYNHNLIMTVTNSIAFI